MNTLLTNKQILYGNSTGYQYVIDSFLGAGTQGEVYRALCNDTAVAIKWYFPNYLASDAELQQRLSNAIKKGSPNARFCWPLELVAETHQDSFGYVMPLRPESFKSIVDLMRRRAEPTFYTLISTCIELAAGFLQLHAKGFCYRDINFNNVFFDAITGEILICDNDNVDINGADGIINGTPRFMAPELVRAEAQPNTESDLFSLAVLLFYMLMLHHPLEGKKEAAIRCFDQAAMNKLYGFEPVFIFNPDDLSNAPIKGLHDNALTYWALYPQFIRDLFITAFTRGLFDTQARVRENEWRSALIRLRDSLLYCSCGAENFYDLTARQQGDDIACWACAKTLIIPPRLRSDNALVMLNHNTRLYPHHIDKNQRFVFDHPVAVINRHPQDPERWGLQNLTNSAWTITTSDNSIKTVEPQRSVALASGVRIDFGNTVADIRL